jgi:hypothetical protein
MPKANRTCYCCGREYYFCPSCPSDRKDPLIYTMWDSEICKDIFNTLVKESTKKITTKECKDKLIELGVEKIVINKESVKKHLDRVMNYKDAEDIKNDIEVVVTEEIEVKEGTDDIKVETNDIVETVEVVEVAETVVEAPKINIKKRKGSYKNNNN